MDVREKLIKICFREFCDIAGDSPCGCDGCPYGEYDPDNGGCFDEYKKYKIEKLENDMDKYQKEDNGVTVQEWIPVKERLPEKDGQYLIFTTQYFTPDHIDEIDHKDGIEISGYCKRYGFLSKNGIHAKYWRDIPQPPKGE